ncbi:uncharacterized protein BT62DRAFT_926237 [Guyanagaster necrorhizus]|uniref:DASH complex subunit ASK1 n=1 Tax=Guyanagaster necrorhizus TaxID=856835 RepID=A0A9P7W689_9AGAR|nr:uncharacterized protein BT62DRAFT_926237 [Guyanagaster necrorhizus MCA 3950]KAG7452021.1 hypothetical protein BT62DRAFT_926237 [Guyanagaster necrorhizus MCA 3950]
MSEKQRRPIPPNPPRWQPNPDPASIEVPGLDTTASVNDQIDQIEQLITIKLQTIDENFSKIHNVLANKILPAVKRYAVATEPVREAAQFWTSFYEQAAQIRIPTVDDYSTVNERTSEHESGSNSHATTDSQAEASHATARPFETSIASAESSFRPGQAAFSSTPARPATTFDTQESEASWSASVESPLVRLDREFQNFSRDEPSVPPSRQEQSRDKPPPSNKGKSREEPQPLLRNLLRQNMHSISEDSTITHSPVASPMKPRGKIKTPVPKTLNPYLPSNTEPSQWNGVVDLRDPSITTPHRGKRFGYAHRARAGPSASADDSDDDSFDGLPPGMSPPVLMSPARLPKSSRKMVLGRTPTGEAAARITKDLVQDIQAHRRADSRHLFHGHSTESSMSTVPTPPSLSRYRGGTDTSGSVTGESSLESMMHRADLGVANIATTPGLRLWPKNRTPGIPPPSPLRAYPQYDDNRGFATDTYGDVVVGQFVASMHHGDEEDDDSFADDDEVNNTAHPSAAFKLLMEGSGPMDDSFASTDTSVDSLDREDIDVEGGPIHPFAGINLEGAFDETFDDSFNDDDEGPEEETLFGVPPAQRMRRIIEADNNDLVLHGNQLFRDGDTGGLTEELGQVAESPTPWSRR